MTPRRSSRLLAASGTALWDRVAAIEYTIARAGELLGRPDLALDADQADALRRIFENRVSIITGPPGSGKSSAVTALANLVARMLYRDMATPIYGVALAGRAASVLADNASVVLESGEAFKFPASTIHRALGLSPDADELDRPEPSKSIECGVLVIDETSMVNAPLLAAIFERTTARRVVLVGDADQLEPIGPGAPMTDLLRGDFGVPVTRLKGNYRAEAATLCELIATIRDATFDEYGLMWSFGDRKSFEYISAELGLRGSTIGKLVGDLVDGGASLHDIAVITPRNVGDDGTETLNRDIRLALGFGPALEVGDLLITTQNNYRALAADNDNAGLGRVAIFNGERCEIVGVKGDVVDALFPGSRATAERRVRFLANGDRPPEGTAFGYAMTAHKAQGSQFKFVILVTMRPGPFVSKASIYTAASRARERLFIVGDETEFVASAARLKPPRRALLSSNVVF